MNSEHLWNRHTCGVEAHGVLKATGIRTCGMGIGMETICKMSDVLCGLEAHVCV